MGTVNITLANGQLGATLQTADGIAGMVLTGISESGGYTLLTPLLVTSLAGLATAGISATNNPFAYRQIKEFYDEARAGAQLYLMLAPATQTIAMLADHTNVSGAKKLLDYAAGRIRLLGIMTDDDAVATATGDAIADINGINDDVLAAVTNMAVMAGSYFAMQQPFRAVIGGTSYNDTPADLPELTAGTSNSRCAVLLGDTVTGDGACLGLALGRLASVPVMRKISRVRTGSLSATGACLGSFAIEDVPGDAAIIAAKGFITWCTYPNVSGYFFSGDDTCSATSDDYHYLARGRVIDKAHMLAYATFVQEVDDEVPVNADGTLEAGFCKWLSRQIASQINNTMTAAREISAVQCDIDPAQNILSTNRLNVVLRLLPVGYATNIEISLGFAAAS
jgi:hypothetical protein